MAQADDYITTLIWLAEAEAMVPSTPKRVLCPLLSEAIATKKLRWDGPPGWRRPDYIDFDNPQVWRRSSWNLSESVVCLEVQRHPRRRFYFYLRIAKEGFLQLIEPSPATAQVADAAQEAETSSDDRNRAQRIVAEYVKRLYGGKDGAANTPSPDIYRAIDDAMKTEETLGPAGNTHRRKRPSLTSIDRYMGHRKN